MRVGILTAVACVGWIGLSPGASAQARKVAAVCVAVDRRLEVDAAAAGVALQKVLENDARLQPVSLTALAQGDGCARKAKEGAALLAEALNNLDEMNEKTALRKSSEAIAAFAESDLSTSFAGLLDSMSARSLALFMAGDKEQVKAELAKLLALKSDYAFDPKRASPAFLALAAEARVVASRGAKSMEVRSSPVAAEVFIDGVYRGIAPASVAGLAPGIHFVTLRAPGYDLAQERAPAGSGAPVSITLKPGVNERGLLELIKAIKTGTPPGSGGTGAKLAKWAGADEALVVSLEKKGDGVHAKLSRFAAEGRGVAGLEGEIRKPEAIEELARKVLFQAEEPIALPPPPALPKAPVPAGPALAAPSHSHAPAEEAGEVGAASPAATSASTESGSARRGGAYIGFGVGWGAGAFVRDGGLYSLASPITNALPFGLALQIGVGSSLGSSHLLGIDVRAVRVQSKDGLAEGTLMADYTLMLTWFPAERGVFLRLGAGASTLGIAKGSDSDTLLGFGGVVGLGYAFQLGQRLHLTLNGDFSAALDLGRQDLPNRPTSSGFFDIYFGLGWY
jgi:hypothetical protein